MKRESYYEKSQNSLEDFSKRFNSTNTHKNMFLIPIRRETYNNDGCIVDLETKRLITFDWEIRAKGFEDGKFSFPTLGQFERKLLAHKDIMLSIQAASDETAFVVAWHSDFLEETVQDVKVSTDDSIYRNKNKEREKIRYTEKFLVFSYDKIDDFKEMLHYAIVNEMYNSESFEYNDFEF